MQTSGKDLLNQLKRREGIDCIDCIIGRGSEREPASLGLGYPYFKSLPLSLIRLLNRNTNQNSFPLFLKSAPPSMKVFVGWFIALNLK